MYPTFVLKPTSDNQFMFNLRAGNNEVILTSERYRTKAGANNGIASVRENSQIDGSYEIRTSGPQFYFVLNAANGQTIGTSERYTSAAGRDKGIASVKANAPMALPDDQT